MKKVFRKEFVIGICMLLALAILYFGIEFLKGANIFHAANYYYVTYSNVTGLSVSAPVTVNGYKVGQVREIKYLYDNPGHMRVELSLDSHLKLPKGTTAVFTTDMLGTSTIAISLAEGNDYYKVGDELPAATAKGLMDAATQDIIPAFVAIAGKVDTLLTATNRLVSDPALAAAVSRLDAMTQNLTRTTELLNRSMATMPTVMSDVKTITGNFSATSQELQKFTHTLNQVPVDSLTQQLQLTLNNIRSITDELNSPNSSLGKILNDPALYDNLNSTAASMDALLKDIQKNPKRYISIKLL